ncbi:hypothetical protein Ancab_030983 [Ancistrocladus abbreviatus]
MQLFCSELCHIKFEAFAANPSNCYCLKIDTIGFIMDLDDLLSESSAAAPARVGGKFKPKVKPRPRKPSSAAFPSVVKVSEEQQTAIVSTGPIPTFHAQPNDFSAKKLSIHENSTFASADITGIQQGLFDKGDTISEMSLTESNLSMPTTEILGSTDAELLEIASCIGNVESGSNLGKPMGESADIFLGLDSLDDLIAQSTSTAVTQEKCELIGHPKQYILLGAASGSSGSTHVGGAYDGQKGYFQNVKPEVPHATSNAYARPPHPAYQQQPPMYMNRGPIARNEAVPRKIPFVALNPCQGRWTIKAKVTAKSELRHYNNPRGDGKVFSFDLLDSDGGEIRVTCFNAVADQFYNQIEVGKVYLISKGSLKPAQKTFNHLPNDHEIYLCHPGVTVLFLPCFLEGVWRCL